MDDLLDRQKANKKKTKPLNNKHKEALTIIFIK